MRARIELLGISRNYVPIDTHAGLEDTNQEH